MKLNYFPVLTPIVLATGLLQPITQTQDIISIKIPLATQTQKVFSHASKSDIEGKGSTNIFSLGRERSGSVSDEKDPLPPRSSSPAGSR